MVDSLKVLDPNWPIREAVMEVTKWLKPSISVSRMGDSASVQAATRVNAEQALYEEGKVKRVVSGGIC